MLITAHYSFSLCLLVVHFRELVLGAPGAPIKMQVFFSTTVQEKDRTQANFKTALFSNLSVSLNMVGSEYVYVFRLVYYK